MPAAYHGVLLQEAPAVQQVGVGSLHLIKLLAVITVQEPEAAIRLRM